MLGDYLSDIDNKILEFDELIKFQKNEIIKTKSFITDFNNVLTQQNDALSRFLLGREQLQKQKTSIENNSLTIYTDPDKTSIHNSTTERNTEEVYLRNDESSASSNLKRQLTNGDDDGIIEKKTCLRHHNLQNDDSDIEKEEVKNNNTNKTGIHNSESNDNFIYGNGNKSNAFSTKPTVRTEIVGINPRSYRYYNHACKFLSQSHQSQLLYADHRMLPNRLKRSMKARATVIIRSNRYWPIVLQHLPFFEIDRELELHIAQGVARMEIIEKRSSHRHCQVVHHGSSYKINRIEENETVKLFPLKEILVLVIEVMLPDFPIPDAGMMISECYRTRMEKGESVIIVPDSPTIIMSTRYGLCNNDDFIPLQVSIMSENGEMLYDSLICPRRTVRKYGLNRLVIKKEDLYDAQDEYEAYARIVKIIQRKIILGCNIYKQIKILKLPISQIAGVREMTTNKAFGPSLELVDFVEYRWDRLPFPVDFIENESMNITFDTSAEVVAVQSIFSRMMKEGKWQDDFVVTMDLDVVQKSDESDKEEENEYSCIEENTAIQEMKVASLNKNAEKTNNPEVEIIELSEDDEEIVDEKVSNSQ